MNTSLSTTQQELRDRPSVPLRLSPFTAISLERHAPTARTRDALGLPRFLDADFARHAPAPLTRCHE